MRDRLGHAAPILTAGLLGGVFFSWIAGWRVLSPTSIDWVMKLDWQHHFIGWHFFRDEPWQVPPGLITRYDAPIGSAIGFTDSVPLAALALKPFSSILPRPFQFLGLWLLICFVLQGMMGALITRLWTRDAGLQVAGGVLFVLVPTLLGRVGHAALASHFLLLWPLWLYWRDPVRPASWRVTALLGLAAGLIHPYLAAMALLIIAALALRRLVTKGRVRSRGNAAATPIAACAAGLVIGWWCSGLLSAGGASDMTSTGLDQYSMNMLGPIAPAGWSAFLPDLPLASQLQAFEGFQYLGAGHLALILIATGLTLWRRDAGWRGAMPLAFVCMLLAVYALSPRVTFGPHVIVDVLTPAMERVAVFRATGRFFWPAAYALVAFMIWAVVTRLGSRTALAVLLAAIALQIADLKGHYESLRETAHSDAFHSWPQPLQSPTWQLALPHYRRLLLYPPEHCGPAPVPFLQPAFLAGTYGLSINTGHLARVDHAARQAYCQQLGRDSTNGVVADDAIYLLHPLGVERFKTAAQRPVVCTVVDGIPVCVTEASYRRWNPGASAR